MDDREREKVTALGSEGERGWITWSICMERGCLHYGRGDNRWCYHGQCIHRCKTRTSLQHLLGYSKRIAKSRERENEWNRRADEVDLLWRSNGASHRWTLILRSVEDLVGLDRIRSASVVEVRHERSTRNATISIVHNGQQLKIKSNSCKQDCRTENRGLT